MKLFLTLLLLSGTLHATEKMNTVRIELEGKRYESLYLHLSLEDFWQFENIRGYSEDGYRWEFSYPDSLYDYIRSFRLHDLQIPDTVQHYICFRFDTLLACNYFFERLFSLVKIRYVGSNTSFNELMFRRGTTEEVFGTFIDDVFEITSTVNDQNLISSMKMMTHGYGYGNARLSYEEMMQRNMDFIRQYPNSRSMMSVLSGNMRGYRSKDDVAKLFNLFTKELQQSFYGREIYRHITRFDTVFKNQMLTTWDIDKLELIVQDSTKFNLILFSAVWCRPCIQLIPALKKIHQDLGYKLIMTYVSVDDERSVENWREKMRTHEIPWRSLMVLTRAKARTLYDDYEIHGVPHAILVHPYTMKPEKLNLWEEEDRQRLYELVNNL